MKPFNHNIKCPRCKNQGYRYKENRINYFTCPCCGLNIFLKHLAGYTKQYEKI